MIVKAVDADDYDPANDQHHSPAWHLYNEWAGNRLLEGLEADPPLGAGLWGGDRTAGLIILHDLGREGKRLADPLQGTDAAEMEVALLAYATSMGRHPCAYDGAPWRISCAYDRR